MKKGLVAKVSDDYIVDIKYAGNPMSGKGSSLGDLPRIVHWSLVVGFNPFEKYR